jgi:hypothetical protein
VVLAQHPTRGAAGVCGRAVASIWQTDLAAASWAIVREARLVWFNSRHGVNTV